MDRRCYHMMKNNLEQSVWETIREWHMIAPGDQVVVGLSGGADSTALLLALHALQGRLTCAISAVHVHHGLRTSADHDEQFCVGLCRRLNIPLTVVHADAAAYADEHGESLEQAGRSIRYAAFREDLQTRGGKGVIATAHHREDLAETVLFNLCRGSGIAGLAGIRPVADDVIRPLLYVSRGDIEDYLREQDQAWCEDETNQDTAITRNYLRRIAIPGLAGNVNAGTVDHLVRLAGEALETEEHLAHETAYALDRCMISVRQPGTSAGGVTGSGTPDAISVTALRREPMILQRRMIRRMLTEAAGRMQDLSAAHVQAVLDICDVTSGTASVDLPYGVTAVRTYDALQFRKARPEGEGESDETAAPGAYRMNVFCRAEGDGEILRAEYTKWFDYDRMGAFPEVRTRQPGDVITIGGGVIKSLHRFMIDEKIPRESRDTMEIPFVGNQALWIPGYQMNAAFKVTQNTTRILEITYM